MRAWRAFPPSQEEEEEEAKCSLTVALFRKLFFFFMEVSSEEMMMFLVRQTAGQRERESTLSVSCFIDVIGLGVEESLDAGLGCSREVVEGVKLLQGLRKFALAR